MNKSVFITKCNVTQLTWIVASQFPEELRGNSEKTAGHNWAWEIVSWRFLVAGTNINSFVQEVPLECAAISLVLSAILIIMCVNYVDKWTNASFIVLRYRI